MCPEEPKSPPSCDLCGLPADPERYLIHTRERILHFCCGGCQEIYRMLHQPEEIPREEPNHG
jgi:hypothetical protein